MHSFFAVWMAVSIGSVLSRVVAPPPIVTPGPSALEVKIARRQLEDPDAISLAEILLTAVPESLRQIAATNVPAVSSILWEQFLDNKRPDWFSKLPWDIQVYLIERFGPATAVVPPSPTGPINPSQTADRPSQPIATNPSQPAPTLPSQPGQTSPSQATETDTSQTRDGSPGVTQSTQEPTTGSGTSPVASQSTTLDATNTEPRTSGTFATGSTGTETPSTAASTAPSSTSVPDAPPANSADDGVLSRGQKVGIGVGVPLGVVATAALLFGCCTLLRRRRRKKVDGSIPPSSPGFIPRFAFQEKPAQREPNERLLNPNSSTSFSDLHNMTWDDEPIYDTSSSGESVPTLNTNNNAMNPYGQPLPQPIMAPALFHTHSSNRARGKRTSYTSLHSVAEVSEPDEDNAYAESPVLPHRSPPEHPQAVKRHSPPRGLVPTLPVPAPSQIKRKPVGMGNISKMPTPNTTAANAASQSLLHQTMMRERNPPTHRPLLATQQVQQQYRRQISSSSASPYVSPVEEYIPRNAFPSYEEDYGPEYSHQRFPPQHPGPHPQMFHAHPSNNDDFIDISDGLYGGNTSLSRYPSPKASASKTEWPLRNLTSGGHRRNKSPMWDRIYES